MRALPWHSHFQRAQRKIRYVAQQRACNLCNRLFPPLSLFPQTYCDIRAPTQLNTTFLSAGSIARFIPCTMYHRSA